ncbi:conjugative transposon protein TraM [Fulvivirgaceae bacterium QH1ED-6-2]|nr:conjugative transposon protein TraM [Parachryseolinea silvisoli]
MALPLLVTPFLLLLFWALGGGQGATAQVAQETSGLNLELPGAHFGKNETDLWDKFSLYEQAKRDSIKYEEARRADPYYAIQSLVPNDSVPKADGKLMTSLGKKDHLKAMQEQEALINKKIEQLTQYVNNPTSAEVQQKTMQPVVREETSVSGPDQVAIDRLEKMMTIMSSSNTEDTEMTQIDQMLDKIIKIQHPEAAIGGMSGAQAHAAGNPTASNVSRAQEDEQVEHFEAGAWQQVGQGDDSTRSIESFVESVYPSNAFYGLDDEVLVDPLASNAIEAVVHETKTLVAGSTLKMRLMADITIGGRLLKKNAFVYGICAIQGERLVVNIKSVSIDNSIHPTALSVYDMDGMEGIYIPGAISRDAAKQAASQSVQDVDLFTMNSSLGAQAAVAGVEAAKGLFSKKAKLIKVTVKAGYKIFLKDASTQTM